MTSPRLRWQKGGEASVLSLAGDAIVLRSTVPAPPGSRIGGALDDGPAAPLAVRVKVHACRRQTEGDFVLEARVLDLTREGRQRLSGAQAVDSQR